MTVSKTGIGAPLARLEDGRFLTGRGNYTDDIARAKPALRALPALAPRPRQDQEARHQAGAEGARRGGGADRR